MLKEARSVLFWNLALVVASVAIGMCLVRAMIVQRIIGIDEITGVALCGEHSEYALIYDGKVEFKDGAAVIVPSDYSHVVFYRCEKCQMSFMFEDTFGSIVGDKPKLYVKVNGVYHVVNPSEYKGVYQVRHDNGWSKLAMLFIFKVDGVVYNHWYDGVVITDSCMR